MEERADKGKLRFLRDRVWQFIGTVFVMISIGVVIYLFILERPVKEMRVVILSAGPLISVDPDVASDVEIRYKGEAIENIASVDFRLENIGNQPIVETDYSRPIAFSFSDNVSMPEILDVSVIDVEPDNLRPQFTMSSDHLVISPTLFNPGDFLIMRVILASSENPDSVNVDARLVGISAVGMETLSEVLQQDGELSRWPFYIFGAIGTGLIIGFVTLFFEYRRSRSIP